MAVRRITEFEQGTGRPLETRETYRQADGRIVTDIYTGTEPRPSTSREAAAAESKALAEEESTERLNQLQKKLADGTMTLKEHLEYHRLTE